MSTAPPAKVNNTTPRRKPATKKAGASTTTTAAGVTFNVVAKKPEAHIITVTPDMADAWLDLNEHNRRLRPEAVAGWAVDMSFKDWKLNGETVKFTKSGRLIDGQHRLSAIITSGEPMETFVAIGLDEDVQSTVDIGRQRSFGDVLKLRGEKNAPKLASVTRRVYLWRLNTERGQNLDEVGEVLAAASVAEHAADKERLDGKHHYQRRPGNVAYLTRGHVKPTVTQMLELLDGPENERLHTAVRMGMWGQRELNISAGMLGLVYYVVERVDTEDAKIFTERFYEGDDLKKGDPIRALRRAVMGRKLYQYVREEVTLAMAFKAWNRWRDGIPMETCNWNPGGRNPETFPIPH
jgi:hypothetical protein